MPTITVQLGNRHYPVLIESGMLGYLGLMMRNVLGGTSVVLIVTDDNVAPLYLKKVQAALKEAGFTAHAVVLPHGEQTKCLDALITLYNDLCALGLTRSDMILALGGGVIGDLAGLAAATYLRGIRFVQVPTTLLAQVDSSVGGKVAVDLPQGKNLVGAFYQPEAVFCDPETLRTLTDEYWRDGLGEVVKYGCIGNEKLFQQLEFCACGGRDALMNEIELILTQCVQHKADVVAQDERDTGLRMTLNFGHTVAHAVETCQHYEGMRHGEAVALGMHVITRLSEQKGMTVPGTAERLDRLLQRLGMPLALPDIPEEALLAAMGHDKKNAGKVLRVVLLEKIGHCFIHETNPAFFQGITAKDSAPF